MREKTQNNSSKNPRAKCPRRIDRRSFLRRAAAAAAAYLGAVDLRVAVAGIACYFSTTDLELSEGSCNYDAEQILWEQARSRSHKTMSDRILMGQGGLTVIFWKI